MKFSKNIEDVIADFRGLPRTVSKSSLKDPLHLDNLLVVIKEQYKIAEPSAERTLVENWEKIFGKTLAPRCSPLRIKDGRVLIVSVSNQTLRSELQFTKRTILRRIQSLEFCDSIEEIVIRG